VYAAKAFMPAGTRLAGFFAAACVTTRAVRASRAL
jgi:hypothetical protein